MCADFSAVVIEDMAAKFADIEGIDWRTVDVRNMDDFGSEVFDVAIDKGTLDAMISGSLWDPPEHVRKNTGSYINEVRNRKKIACGPLPDNYLDRLSVF